MTKNIWSFDSANETTRLYVTRPDIDDDPYSPGELKTIIEVSAKRDIDMTIISDAKGGVVAIVPEHLASILVGIVNKYANDTGVTELNSSSVLIESQVEGN